MQVFKNAYQRHFLNTIIPNFNYAPGYYKNEDWIFLYLFYSGTYLIYESFKAYTYINWAIMFINMSVGVYLYHKMKYLNF